MSENFDKDGKFTKGNTASTGPQRKKAHVATKIDHIDKNFDVRDLNGLLPQLTTVQDVADVWGALLIKAKKGDVKAAGMVLERLGGKAARTHSADSDLFTKFMSMAERYRVISADKHLLSEPNTNTDTE